MDIQIHSRLSVQETYAAVSNSIKKLIEQYETRFWVSEIRESSPMSKEILSGDFEFQSVCEFMVSDVEKEFDGLDIVARTLRGAIGANNCVVIYGDTVNCFQNKNTKDMDGRWQNSTVFHRQVSKSEVNQPTDSRRGRATAGPHAAARDARFSGTRRNACAVR